LTRDRVLAGVSPHVIEISAACSSRSAGSYLLHHHHMNMVAMIAHMSRLLAAADVLIVEERKQARAFAFAGIARVVGSQLLLGFPQRVWWNAIGLGSFVVFRAAETQRWRQLPVCAASLAIGVLLGGIQLLPTVDAVAHSVRMDVTQEFSLTLSLQSAGCPEFAGLHPTLTNCPSL
jgi:hypothetical protein